MHMCRVIIFVILAAGFSIAALWSTPDVDGKFGDIKGPVLRSDFGVRLDTVAIGLVDRICVVLACLNWLVLKLLCNLRYKLIIVANWGFGFVIRCLDMWITKSALDNRPRATQSKGLPESMQYAPSCVVLKDGSAKTHQYRWWLR
jgi:hypothetical protein